MPSFDIESYVPVQDRVREFWQDYPNGSIQTRMVVRDGPEIVFEARVYRTVEEATAGVYTSGFAREVEGKSPVNKTAHLENAESSAVGRALANLGYATSADRPSRSEMLKVARMTEEHTELLDYLRTEGAKVEDAALRERIRAEWSQAKEQMRVARLLADAVETALEAQAVAAEAGA